MERQRRQGEREREERGRERGKEERGRGAKKDRDAKSMAELAFLPMIEHIFQEI